MPAFACPWYKQDPNTLRLPAAQYEICAANSWPNIGSLLVHLATAHDAHVCTTCFAPFPTKDERVFHMFDCSDYVSMSHEERWQLLWGKLFPNTPPPKSPYKELSSRDTSSATPVTASKNNTRYHPYSKPREAGRAKNASKPPPASAHNSVHTQTRSQVRPGVETANTQHSGVPSAGAQGPGPQTTAFLRRDIPSSSRTEASFNGLLRYPTPVHQPQPLQPPPQPPQPQPPSIPSLQASSSFSFTNLVSPEDIQRNSSLYPHAGAKGSKPNQDNLNPYFPPIGETQYPVNNVPVNNLLYNNVPAGNVFENNMSDNNLPQNNLPSSWAPGPNSGGSQQ